MGLSVDHFCERLVEHLLTPTGTQGGGWVGQQEEEVRERKHVHSAVVLMMGGGWRELGTQIDKSMQRIAVALDTVRAIRL